MALKKWKKSTLTLLVIAFMGAGGSSLWVLKKVCDTSKPVEWIARPSCNERFDVLFPADPKESSERMNVAGTTIQYNELRSEKDDSVYAVSYIDFPSHWKWLGTKKLLTKSFDSFVSSQEGVEEILGQEISNHHGIPALAYHIKQYGKEVKGKFIISGNTLYRVAVTYLPEKAEVIAACPFFDSFQIKA